MLYLNPDATNKLYIVCDDILSITDPIYLWRFESEQDTEDLLIELTNEEPNNPRFDLFTLVLPTDLDLTTGKFHWYVYQSDEAGKTDFENMPLLADGRADVDTTFEQDNTYTPDGNDKTYKPE